MRDDVDSLSIRTFSDEIQYCDPYADGSLSAVMFKHVFEEVPR